MKNRVVKEYENKIIDKRINIIEPELQNRNKKSLNEVRRSPVKYSIGHDYLYTYRIYDIKKKYINGEISREQYENVMTIIKNKMIEDARRRKLRTGEFYDIEAMKNKKFR